jgi:hypothetical protein
MTLNKPRIRGLHPYIYHLMEDPHKRQVSLTQVQCLFESGELNKVSFCMQLTFQMYSFFVI